MKLEILKGECKAPSTCMHTILEKTVHSKGYIQVKCKYLQVKCKSEKIPESDSAPCKRSYNGSFLSNLFTTLSCKLFSQKAPF